LPGTLFTLPILFFALIDLLENSMILLQERYYTFALVGLTPIIGHTLSANWESRLNKVVIIFFLSALAINSLLVINGLAWEEVSVPRTKNACLWIKQELRQNRGIIIIFNRRACVLPMAFYLDQNIIIAPINDFVELKKTFSHVGSDINTIFVAEPIFKNQNNYPIESELSGVDIVKVGFTLEERRIFGNDHIKVIKLVRIKS
jgi:hypothetical protein